MTSTASCGLLVLAGIVLAGCATHTERPGEATLAADTTTTRPVGPSLPTTTTPFKSVESTVLNDLKKAACEQAGVLNPDSPPYAGAGPHWAEAYEMPITGRRMQNGSFTAVGAIGSDVRVPGAGQNVNLNDVQLIACVLPVLDGQAGTVTCSFDKDPRGVATSRTWPFFEASYQVTVREARTGRQITVLTVPGVNSPEESCPLFATDDPGTVVARSITDQALGEAMRPLVFGAV